MTGGLIGQTCSTCLTVEERRAITVGNTRGAGIRNMKLDHFLPVWSMFADWGTTILGAASETYFQISRALAGQAGPG